MVTLARVILVNNSLLNLMATNTNLLSNWVNEYTEDMFSWAFHKVSDAELAKDFVQETFLAASEKIDGFKGNSSPKTWLFSILNHKIIDHYRKKTNKTVSFDEHNMNAFFDEHGSWQHNKIPKDWDNADDNLLDDDNFQTILKKCLNALPEKWAATIKYKYLMQKKPADICQELEITTSNYWQIVHRAKLQLRDCIEVNWFEN